MKNLKPNMDKKTKDSGEIRLLGRVPNKIQSVRLKKMNKYLDYQNGKLEQYKKNGNMVKAFHIWMILLKTSRSYQTYLFHANKPNWYIRQELAHLTGEWIRFVNNCRQWKFGLELERFYVLKSKDPERHGMRYEGDKREGEKLRPIGSPTLSSGALSKAFTDLLTWSQDHLRPENQHGYRPKRGVHTAIAAIAKMYKPGITVIEFDLRSFFNKVSQGWIYHTLIEINQKVASIVFESLWKVNYKFKSLEKEAELNYMFHRMSKGKKKPYIRRSGLPQGLSLSPLLSTLALEWVGIPKEITMYADDGIFIGNSVDFAIWRKKIGRFDMKIAEHKTRIVEGECKFLGVTLDFKKRTVKLEDIEISFDDPDLERMLSRIHRESGGSLDRGKWTWDIAENAMLTYANIRYLPIYTAICVDISSWFDGQYKNIKRINGKYYHVTNSSSICLDRLVELADGLNYKKIRSFTFNQFERNLSPETKIQNRRNHCEVWNNESNIIMRRNKWKDLYPHNIIKVNPKYPQDKEGFRKASYMNIADRLSEMNLWERLKW